MWVIEVLKKVLLYVQLPFLIFPKLKKKKKHLNENKCQSLGFCSDQIQINELSDENITKSV